MLANPSPDIVATCCDPSSIDCWRASGQEEERAKVKVHKRVRLQWVLATLISSTFNKDPKWSECFLEMAESAETGAAPKEQSSSLLASHTPGELGLKGEICLSLVNKGGVVGQCGISINPQYQIQDDVTNEGQDLGAAQDGDGVMRELVNLKVRYSSKADAQDGDLENQVRAHPLRTQHATDALPSSNSLRVNALGAHSLLHLAHCLLRSALSETKLSDSLRLRSCALPERGARVR